MKNRVRMCLLMLLFVLSAATGPRSAAVDKWSDRRTRIDEIRRLMADKRINWNGGSWVIFGPQLFDACNSMSLRDGQHEWVIHRNDKNFALVRNWVIDTIEVKLNFAPASEQSPKIAVHPRSMSLFTVDEPPRMPSKMTSTWDAAAEEKLRQCEQGFLLWIPLEPFMLGSSEPLIQQDVEKLKSWMQPRPISE